MSRELKKHLKLENSKESMDFTPITGGGRNGPNIPIRNRVLHSNLLEKQFNAIWENEKVQDEVAYVSRKEGIYLEFVGQKKYDLIYRSLENISQDVRLCNVRKKGGVQYATVFVPHNKKDFFLNKINKYKETENSEKVIASIESINQAMVRALWTDKREIPIKEKEACEIWLSVYKKDIAETIVEGFFSLCDSLQIVHYDGYTIFPERAVVSVMANMEILKTILANSSHIAEFRKNDIPNSFFIENNNFEEQKEWCEELIERTTFEDSNCSICLLDKGVSNRHPLLAPVLADTDMHTTFDDKVVQDRSNDGHGTGMAGITTYFNLEDSLENSKELVVSHRLESVRFVDDNIENDISLYADVTSKAISLAEISNPKNSRVIAMPVTSKTSYDSDKNNKDYFRGDGKPSSLSAGIDNLALGNYEEEDSESRLIIVSAGNTSCKEMDENESYKEAVINHSVENPGQSWNALTVGAFTEKTSLSDDPLYKNYVPLVEKGGYSPYNSSSLLWDNKWPIKPDIVLEGGNVAYNKDSKDFKYISTDDLNSLTSSKRFHTDRFFTTINGTSSATAQAANIAVNLMKEYPGIWPQTIRALMVHSARWTDEMIRQIFGDKKIEELKKKEFRKLLRIVGYGVPSLEKALYSIDNSVNLIVEEEIQPFKKGKSVTINELDLHEIPWPSEVLMALGQTKVRMKVTLSYFIEPSPGQIGWENKYIYPGCRLYFDVNNINEDRETFLERINKKIRDQAKKTEGYIAPQNDSSRWVLGSDNRNVGSIHSDIWIDTAANLAENRYIAVYPGSGWWKERANLKRYNSKIRYALVVSISTPDESVDLYTPIQNMVNITNKVKVETTIEQR